MWRRFGLNQQQQPSIGNPTLLETTVDDGYLETIQEVESIASRQNSVRHPSQLPELPFRTVPPLAKSHYDRASSVYSQDGPDISEDRDKNLSREQDALYRSATTRSEVSSLTVRSSVDDESRSSPLISPLSTHFPEHDVLPRQEHPFRTQLPRPVPAESKGPNTDPTTPSYRKASPAVTTEKKQETRWDDFSGEPTDSEAGKPASSRPGVAPIENQYPQLKERTKQILADLRERDPGRKTGWGKPPPIENLDHPAYREPWKGASGRAAIVEPVKNTPAARLEPLHIPQRNISRTHVVSNEAARQQSPEPESLQTARSERQEPTIRAVASQDSIKPVVPLKLGSANSSRVVSPTTPMVPENAVSLQSPFKSPQHTFLHIVHESVTKTAEELVESPTDDDPLTPTTPTQANTTTHARMANLLPPEPEEADVSRFSWTTCTTTEQGSPTQSACGTPDLPPMPSVPSPILLRKRPVAAHKDLTPYMNSVAAFSNASVVSRKPVPAADRNRSSSMTTANPSLGKSLPQCPPELEASDKIATLEARLDDLARRKRNINKIKAALSDSLRRNAIAYDVNKRKDVEAKLKGLEDEMSEVTQEEHEVGLRLHRAQKKRDREENNLEPTSLWIKRVTS